MAAQDQVVDVAVVGAGPGGLACAAAIIAALGAQTQVNVFTQLDTVMPCLRRGAHGARHVRLCRSMRATRGSDLKGLGYSCSLMCSTLWKPSVRVYSQSGWLHNPPLHDGFYKCTAHTVVHPEQPCQRSQHHKNSCKESCSSRIVHLQYETPNNKAVHTFSHLPQLTGQNHALLH